MDQPLRVGILYPLSAAEDDFPRMAARFASPVEVEIAHTNALDIHTIEECRRTGSPARLLEGAATLGAFAPHVCLWACTSGSFVYGVAGAQAQAQEIASFLGVPVSSTSLAFLHALQTVGFTRVAIAASYPPELAAAFCTFLGEGGIEVIHLGCLGVWSGGEVGTIKPEDVMRFAKANDHADAEALLIPDTALHTVDFLAELEQYVGKPVLTANQVTLWEGLRLGQRLTMQPDLGHLFSHSTATVQTLYMDAI
jgi:maleate cis-trans isomerase